MSKMCHDLVGHEFAGLPRHVTFHKWATIFFGMGGHEFPKVPRQYFCDPPYLMIKNFMTPLRSYNVEETPMRVAQKIFIFGAISLNKIFIKICSHPKIS